MSRSFIEGNGRKVSGGAFFGFHRLLLPKQAAEEIEAAARGRGGKPKAERGRDGIGLKRGDGAIGYAALRGGTVVGDHDVQFLGTDERLILSHRAESRAIFARGALAGARFLVGQPAGLYTMRDVIDSL